MSKVYVVNDLNHDFYKAEKFGKLVYITEGKMPIFKTDVIKTLMQDKLVMFTEDDYLLITGPAIMCIMATLVVVGLFTEKFVSTQVKLLVFDAKGQEYVVRHVSL